MLCPKIAEYPIHARSRYRPHLHCHTLTAFGIKHKIYDQEFLLSIVDLINEHGVAITLGECIQKAVPHFIASVKYNLTGQNAIGKV